MPTAIGLMSTSAQTGKQKQRSPLEKERDLFRIEELHLKGFTISEIAELIGLTKRQTVFDLQELTRRYSRGTERNAQRDLNQQLRKLDFLEREGWRAYEASKIQREITTQRQKRTDGSGNSSEIGKRLEQRDGDMRCLSVVQWCIDKRNLLLGLYPEEARAPRQLQNVTEIVYELPAAQQVPALRPQPAKAREPKAMAAPVPEDLTAVELWGADDDQDVLIIEPRAR